MFVRECTFAPCAVDGPLCTGHHKEMHTGKCARKLRACSRQEPDSWQNEHGYIHVQHLPRIEDWEDGLPDWNHFTEEYRGWVDLHHKPTDRRDEWEWKQATVWKGLGNRQINGAWTNVWRTRGRCFRAVKGLDSNVCKWNPRGKDEVLKSNIFCGPGGEFSP